MKDEKHKAYHDMCMSEPIEDVNSLSESMVSFYARKFLELKPACNAMGGWANFRYWIKRHAVNYFNSLEPMEKEIASLRNRVIEAELVLNTIHHAIVLPHPISEVMRSYPSAYPYALRAELPFQPVDSFDEFDKVEYLALLNKDEVVVREVYPNAGTFHDTGNGTIYKPEDIKGLIKHPKNYGVS